MQQIKKKKILVPRVVNGVDTMVEIEVDDVQGDPWGPNNRHSILNHDIRRVDGPQKVTGKARYTHDVRLEGLLYGVILASSHPSAEVTSVDTSRAARMAGVKAVLTINTGVVHYEGDPVAAVAADTPEHAEDAARAIHVAYRATPHAVTRRQALAPGAPQVLKSVPGNHAVQEKRGDRAAVETALHTAEHHTERTFEITMQHHVCLETHGVTVDYRGGDHAIVYASTQGTFTIPAEAAQALGLKDQNAVEAIVEYMGGGFGSKFGLDLPGQIACALSKKASAPVKLMLTRRQEFLAAGNRPGAWLHVRAAAGSDGKLRALTSEQVELGGLGEGGLAGLPYIYTVPAVYREGGVVHTHQDASRAMRGPGHPQASFAMESIMDDLAAKLGMDPIEFRKRNTADPAYARQLDMAAGAIGWHRRPAVPGKGPRTGRFGALQRGFGCACATWGGGGGAGCQVDLTIDGDGAVAVQVGTQDLGTGSRTYTAAIVAQELGLHVSDIATRIGHSTYGAANPSGGSTTTASLAPAVKDAASQARRHMIHQVAGVLGVQDEDLSLADGQFTRRTNPGQKMSWKRACSLLGPKGLSIRGTWKPGISGNGVHGVQMAEVEVDRDTGKVRVVKMVGVQDCGLPLNRRAVQSQLNGGMIQGLGYALLEEHVVDERTGLMLNPNMEEYKIPGCMEIPEMIALIDDGDTREVVIGMAEPAAIPGASAIANAVFNACGARITSLPITPDKVLLALHGAHAGHRVAGGGPKQ